MQCEARSQLNQGRVWGVYINTRPKRCPPIRQEIARNAPPQVIFFTKIETKPINYKRKRSAFLRRKAERFFSAPHPAAAVPHMKTDRAERLFQKFSKDHFFRVITGGTVMPLMAAYLSKRLPMEFQQRREIACFPAGRAKR